MAGPTLEAAQEGALAVAPSGPRGMGLFTRAPRRAGDHLFTVAGTARTGTYDDEFGVGPTWFGAGARRWIEPEDGNPGRFLNHSCGPNARVEDFVRIVAARDIAAGEEITIDYALTEEDPFWSMECRCGASACRGVIRAGARFGD